MSTGSLSDVDDELLDGIFKFGSSSKDSGTSNESAEEGSAGERGDVVVVPGRKRGGVDVVPGRKRGGGDGVPGRKRKSCASPGGGVREGKQVQRNAANARERARMRVLSRAFSRLKGTLPWVPADTKLSKLDTLRLASSYIAHLRQVLANDEYDHGYIHPVNLTWPFMVAGKPENDLKEMLNATRLCGTTAS
ncbi:transcription factor 21 [Lampris incognitus]|uniref:transcription factor 21 n=1 Tax=Lampris incognitus TaxID=2546036 RepID=UPI0024B4FD12|nr:transcription factor 21 [Lampris incognitus]